MRHIKVFAAATQAAVLGLLLFAAPATPQTNLSQDDPILGTWSDVTTVLDPPPGFANGFTTVVSFSREGNLLVNSNVPNVTTAQGAFVKTGKNRYSDTFYFFGPGPSPGLLLATRVVENIEVAPGGNTYVATVLIEPLDGNGNVLIQIHATVAAKRFPLSTYTVQP